MWNYRYLFDRRIVSTFMLIDWLKQVFKYCVVCIQQAPSKYVV